MQWPVSTQHWGAASKKQVEESNPKPLPAVRWSWECCHYLPGEQHQQNFIAPVILRISASLHAAVHEHPCHGHLTLGILKELTCQNASESHSAMWQSSGRGAFVLPSFSCRSSPITTARQTTPTPAWCPSLCTTWPPCCAAHHNSLPIGSSCCVSPTCRAC